MATSEQINAFNSRQLSRPEAHALVPREKGGTGCRNCVLAENHPVHTTPPASNVVLLGGGRRAKRGR